MADGVPYLTFESAEFPAGEGRRRWEALTGAYDVTVPDGQAEADFDVKSESWLLGELVITHGRLTPVVLNRSETRIAADGRETFTIGLVTRGLLAGDFDGRACELRPGQVCVIDFARPWRAHSGVTEFILLSVPRAAFLAVAPNARELHGRLLDGATARILTEHLMALVRHLPQVGSSEAPVVQRATLRMVGDSLEALAPCEDVAAEPMESRLTYRARRFIDEQLSSADLSPATICAAVGVSRPTLYRAFRRGGGIMSYVQRRRLEAVHVRLSDPAETRGVAELALAAGYASHAHFSTAFRRRFGYAPRDARPGGGSGPVGNPALQFRSWVLNLATPPDPP